MPLTKIPFEVYPFNTDKLLSIFAAKSQANHGIIEKKLHFIYFQEYFENLKCKTILVENDYVDKDFLEDYASYYVRCFSEYKRKCTRLHFFKREFDADAFDALLRKENGSLKELLTQDYLGFIVVKPLPLTIIGRTCLAPYPEEAGKDRNFPIIRKYEAHLFGIPLSIKSLAFQEQDNVVAACATSALWSVFHGTGILFQHSILSPGEITKEATKQLPIETRTFPNKGLSGEQMAHAIQSVNLEPLLLGINNKAYNLKSSIYAYLRFGIPLILGIDLYDTSGIKPTYLGKHAVAVSGYRLEAEQTGNDEDENLLLVSSGMNKIYVHDDQVGPFARMELDNQTIELAINGFDTNLMSMSTSWKTEEADIGNIRAVPQMLLVPLYHKIRISFETIHETIKYFNSVIEGINKEVPILGGEKIIWDIYLTDVNKLKSTLFSSEQYTGEYFKEVLLKEMPRFLWRATAMLKNKFLIDFLFDATDIEQGEYFICAIEYDKDFSLILREIFREDIFEKILINTTAWKMVRWFKD